MTNLANAAMNRYAWGDETAFAELYDCLAPKLFTFLMRQTRDRALAEDLVQQTFLQMHCARDGYSADADVLPWAFAIARRLMIDGFRRSKREVQRDIEDFELREWATPDAFLCSKRAAVTVQRTLEMLPPAQRVAFELVKYDGLSMAEAASVLGTTPTTVKLRTHRAYQAIRTALGDGQEAQPRTLPLVAFAAALA